MNFSFMTRILILASVALSAFAAQLGTKPASDLVSHVPDAKAYGAGIEGGAVTDATARLQTAVDALRDGQTLQIPLSLVRSPLAGRPALSVVGKKNVIISGAITNDQFGIDSSYWKTI